MTKPMAASSHSVDSHPAAHISCDDTTVAVMSYNVGIHNEEVKSKGWAKSAKLQKLKADVRMIFEHQHGIQITCISEMGNTVGRLSHNSGGPHPTAQGIFEGIITDLGLTHIQVCAHAPYVALIDTLSWHVITCKLVDNLCGKKKKSSFRN